MTHHVLLANGTVLSLASTTRAVLPPLSWRDSPLARALAPGRTAGPPGPFGREVPCDHLTLEGGLFISRASNGAQLQDVTYPGPALSNRAGTALSPETLANALLGHGVLAETSPGGAWRYGTLRGDGVTLLTESPDGTAVPLSADWRASVVLETSEGWEREGVPRLPKVNVGSRWTSDTTGGRRWFAPLRGHGAELPGPTYPPTIRGGPASPLSTFSPGAGPSRRVFMVELNVTLADTRLWTMVLW